MDAKIFDLTGKLGKFLDRHLLVRIVQFVQKRQIFGEEEMLCAILQLLRGTNMVDFALGLMEKLSGAEASEDRSQLLNKRAEVVAEMRERRTQNKVVLDFLKDTESIDALNAEDNFKLSVLDSRYGINRDSMEKLREYAKFLYECGQYNRASEYLSFYVHLLRDSSVPLSAIWGYLASEILVLEEMSAEGQMSDSWSQVQGIFQLLKKNIENNYEDGFLSDQEVLNQRTWLLHWALFVYFCDAASSLHGFIDFVLQPHYLQTMEATCPHLLRYLSVALMCTRRKRGSTMKELVGLIALEKSNFSDPITKFVEQLFGQCDFEEAERLLRECPSVLENDFFLAGCVEDFMENARVALFEMYCRTYRIIDISSVAEKLGLSGSSDDAERWVADVVRNFRLDAKIDSQRSKILLRHHEEEDLYQQVIDRSKGMFLRTEELLSALSGGESNPK